MTDKDEIILRVLNLYDINVNPDKREFYFACIDFRDFFEQRILRPAQTEFNKTWLPLKGGKTE